MYIIPIHSQAGEIVQVSKASLITKSPQVRQKI